MGSVLAGSSAIRITGKLALFVWYMRVYMYACMFMYVCELFGSLFKRRASFWVSFSQCWSCHSASLLRAILHITYIHVLYYPLHTYAHLLRLTSWLLLPQNKRPLNTTYIYRVKLVSYIRDIHILSILNSDDLVIRRPHCALLPEEQVPPQHGAAGPMDLCYGPLRSKFSKVSPCSDLMNGKKISCDQGSRRHKRFYFLSWTFVFQWTILFLANFCKNSSHTGHPYGAPARKTQQRWLVRNFHSRYLVHLRLVRPYGRNSQKLVLSDFTPQR